MGGLIDTPSGGRIEKDLVCDKCGEDALFCRCHHVTRSPEFVVKDSGARHTFASGMVRDTQENKIDWWRTRIGPMLKRWAAHVTKACVKYPDVSPGVPNWTLANGPEELQRFKASADRHFAQWMAGDVDEDHAAAVIFNVNGAEFVKERMKS